MRVETIRLINFRNYRNIKVELNPKLNIFLGDNAQGKTNLLESIYISALGRSYKTNRDRELINHEKTQAYIGLETVNERGDRFIEVKFDLKRPKRIRINKIELDRVNDILGNLNVVIFSPEDLKLVKEGPGERRDFLDNEISQIKPLYRHNIQKYNNVLFQRNRLLKSRNRDIYDTIEVWDSQLAEFGARIMTDRMNFIDKLKKISSGIHRDITGGKEKLDIEYISSVNYISSDFKELRDYYREKLENGISEDIERGNTGLGIHKDDLEINIDGMSCRNYGSQGQQRTAALSLKLAEVELIKEEIGEYPVILLDDVLSELDINRRTKLISSFRDIQTIITSTDDIELEEYSSSEKTLFHIEQGNIYKG